MFVPVLPVEVPVLLTSKAHSGVEVLALVATTSSTLLVQAPVELENNDSRILPSVSWKNNRLSPFGRATTATEVSFCSPLGTDVALPGDGETVGDEEL